MVPTKEYSHGVKECIVKLLQDGKTQTQVSKLIGCSQGMVCNIWSRYQTTGSVKNCPGRGRTMKATKRQDRMLVQICKKKRKATSREVNHQWESSGVKVTDRKAQD